MPVGNSGSELQVFAFFHLNLMFSSIAEEARKDVIERCYWPLLDLPSEAGVPIGLEATGLTLEIIQALDPVWIDALRQRIDSREIALIGSGYAQIIGPLVPAAVNRWNLRLGLETYSALLGERPRLALVNEQAFSAGLVPLYQDAGYEALLLDWDNVRDYHPEWSDETQFRPQYISGAGGARIKALWTQTMAFQKLQRLAHGELSQDGYLDFVLSQQGQAPRAYCLYSNDAEVFDFRPKRLHTEEELSGNGEWARIASAWRALKGEPRISFVPPHAALAPLDAQGHALRIETAQQPAPVKKQPKYNIARWAVAGRDNMRVNAACHQLTQRLLANDCQDPVQWRAMCQLWSSDFRTHIEPERWTRFKCGLDRLAASVTSQIRGICPAPYLSRSESAGRFLEIETAALRARFNRRRGLALDFAAVQGDPRPPMIGSLAHGYYPDAALQADWYSGHLVFEWPGHPKVTDLEWAQETVTTLSDRVLIEAQIQTPLGPIQKRIVLHNQDPRIDWDLTIGWPDMPRGSLRPGHALIMPQAFHWDRLAIGSHLGGEELEWFPLAPGPLNHGAAVSSLVSATTGLGMTEGILKIADGERALTLITDRSVSPMLAMIEARATRSSYFCLIQFSAAETDDTRRIEPGPNPPLSIRYSAILS